MIKLHYPEGMAIFGDNACKDLDFEKYDPNTDRDQPAMFWLYTLEDYKTLANHTGKKYVVWHNADVLLFSGKFSNQIDIVRDPSITHVCLNHCLEPELFQLGIYSIHRYIFWSDPGRYKPAGALTKDCYMCSHEGRGPEYGEFIFNGLAWKYPQWTFHIFGIEPTLPVYCENVKYYGWIPEPDMDDITKNFGLCLRYNFHDGFPQVICKALLRGQFTLTRLDYDGLTLNFRDMKELFEKFDSVNIMIEKGSEGLTERTNVKNMINNFDFIKL